MTYLLILFINYMSGISVHAFHVSVCEIVFDEEERQLEITHRIFLDDLELGLNQWSDQRVDVLNPSDPKALDELIGKYLSEKTSYQLNGKNMVSKYLGSEREEAVMYCYQVITDVKKMKALNVTNEVLMDLYDDQSNIIHVENSGLTKSMKFSAGESTGEVIFD